MCNKIKLKIEFSKYRAKCKKCRTVQAKTWRHANSEKHNTYQLNYKNKKYNTNINFKLKVVLRARLRKSLKNDWKVGSSVELLGCSIEELREHLESKFEPGMTWENWSRTGWHIDHKEPLDSFNLQNKEELGVACNYTNLQPLWAEDNCSKSNKVE